LSMYNEPLSVYNEPLSMYNEPLSMYNEPLSMYNESLSVYNESLSMYNASSAAADRPFAMTDRPFAMTDRPFATADRPSAMADRASAARNDPSAQPPGRTGGFFLEQFALTKVNSTLKFIKACYFNINKTKGADTMASNIGIKIANGEFYPLIEENSSIKKKMVLTTACDNQNSVQIDLFRSIRNVMNDAQYIGSLVIGNIKPKPKGVPSIELVISSDSRGDIIAEAVDLDRGPKGDHHVLTVSLKSLDDTRDMEITDYDDIETGGKSSSGLYNHARKIKRKKKHSFAWVFVLLIIVVVLGLFGGWLFYFGGMDIVNSRVDLQKVRQFIEQYTPDFIKKLEFPKHSTPPAPIKQPEPVKQAAPAPAVATVIEVAAAPAPAAAAVIEAAAAPAPKPQTASRSPPPVASYKVPATIPKEGVDYRVRWGDTLWDISYAFYHDPWLYSRIARYNNIRNPNQIISGRTIKIPPKN